MTGDWGSVTEICKQGTSWQLIVESFNLVSQQFHALFVRKNERTIPINLPTQYLSLRQCKQMTSSIVFHDVMLPCMKYLPITKIPWAHCTSTCFQFQKLNICWLKCLLASCRSLLVFFCSHGIKKEQRNLFKLYRIVCVQKQLIIEERQSLRKDNLGTTLIPTYVVQNWCYCISSFQT